MNEFIINARPVAKERPRKGRNGFYTPRKTKNFEEIVKWSFLKSKIKKIEEGAVKVSIKAYFKIPKRTSKKKINQLMNSYYPKKLDADNIAKSILDALNKLAYTDDKQVTNLQVEKRYSDKEFIKVLIDRAA